MTFALDAEADVTAAEIVPGPHGATFVLRAPVYGPDAPVRLSLLGRFNVSGLDKDKNVFKVPSLRNVALTAPYFHDGTAATLEAAVEVMFVYQLGRTAPPQDKALIVAFLKTLTGERQPSLTGTQSNPVVAAALPAPAKQEPAKSR